MISGFECVSDVRFGHRARLTCEYSVWVDVSAQIISTSFCSAILPFHPSAVVSKAAVRFVSLHALQFNNVAITEC